MSNFYRLLIAFSFFISATIGTGQNITISGRIVDFQTNEPLAGAQVFLPLTSSGTASDGLGQFSLPVATNSIVFVRFIGYADDTLFVGNSTRTFFVKLKSESISTEEVTISAKKLNENIYTAQSGVYYLSPKTISKLPAFMGEADPIRALSVSPGVSQTEGSQGFSVRGAGREQNLILLNGAPVYNPSHLLGLFSVFNPNAISEVTLMKSGIPAQYGGRLSSVMLVETGTHRPNRLQVKGSLGLLASGLHLSIPIIKDKLWIAVGGRQTYLHLITEPITDWVAKEKSKSIILYSFSDFDGDLEYKLNSRNYIDASFYYGNDYFTFKNRVNNLKNNVEWGNRVATLRWRFIPSESFSWTNTAYHSAYIFGFEADQENFNLDISTNIYTSGYTSAFYKQLPANDVTLRWGFEFKHHIMDPNRMKVFIQDEALEMPQSQRLYATEPAIYCQAEIPVADKFLFSVGVRGDNFTHWGAYMRESADAVVSDSIFYTNNEPIQTYYSIQPRFAVRYLLSEFTSLKASYNYMTQNMHLTSMSSSALPADVWFPSSYGVQPMHGHQFTVGYFRNFREQKYQASAELFAKHASNVAEIGDSFYQSNNSARLDQSAYWGVLKTGGVEFSVNKVFGKLTGTVSCAYSRSYMTVPDIDNGKSYPSSYDKPIDASIFLNHNFNKKWSASGYFIYTSGKTATMPVQRYLVSGNLMNVYTGRNQFRMPAYHRFDLSIIRNLAHRSGKESQLVFSVYNLYSRLNPYYIYFETSGDLEKQQLQVETKAVSFFPILPSISWRFSF